ncbi:hypothetical protein A6R68_19459 [Neotoma lepida]|uniref:D(1A) dopamine receptor n=1 Tax=Neotoma lepida TaxID=56216 RepID=A0A1A6HJJ8_NEOLE|nr:hypothetical protein A6R68_19459 [Neotoma lepida]
MDGAGLAVERDFSFRILTACFLSLLILSTLLGNTLVCAAVIRFRHLRSKVTNFFVISLAVSDLLVAVLVMPWKAVAEIAGFWPFGSFCNIWVAFDIMCSTASILNLCVISVDRYWAISSPFQYERKMTPKAAFILISVAWTLSVLISFIPVQLSWHKAKPTWPLDGNSTFLEDIEDDNCDTRLSRTYAISSSLISFYIPVAIMIVTYTSIYRIAQKQIRRISALERAAVHAKNCQTTTGCYRLCPTTNNAIETVSINNNGAVAFSSHHEPRGSISKDCNLVYLIPHAVGSSEDLKKEEAGGIAKPLEKLSPALSVILDYDTDVSLEKIQPVTHSGQHPT